MRRTLGPLLLLPLLLAGCGEEGTGSATDDPTSSASSTPAAPTSPTSPNPTDEPLATDGANDGATVLGLVHETNAGGTVSDQLTSIDGDGLLDFLTQLDSSSLSEQVMAIAEDNPPTDGHRLMAAVVALGCDVPPGVTVSGAPDDSGTWTVIPDKVTAPLQECLAPVTTVAVVDVPLQG